MFRWSPSFGLLDLTVYLNSKRTWVFFYLPAKFPSLGLDRQARPLSFYNPGPGGSRLILLWAIFGAFSEEQLTVLFPY